MKTTETTTITIKDKRMLKFFRKQFAMSPNIKFKVGDNMSVSGGYYNAKHLHAAAVSCERTAFRSVTATRDQIRALARETKIAAKNGNHVAVFFDGAGWEQVSREARFFGGKWEWPIMLLNGKMTAAEIADKIDKHNAYVASFEIDDLLHARNK